MATGEKSTDGDFGFQIAPMVDVVFVLLLFFMACAGSKQTEGLLTVGLPSPGSEDARAIVPIRIKIDDFGNIFVADAAKGNATSEDQLETVTEQLIRAMQLDRNDPVIIQPTLAAQHGWIVKVLNCCRQAKVQKLSFG